MIKKYTFDLDLPEEKRWLPILSDFKGDFPFLHSQIQTVLEEFGIGKKTCLLVKHLIERYEASILYLGEMKSIARMSDIPLEKIFLLQLCYEASAACTTVITVVEGNPIFVRTLDWDFNWLKKFTVQLCFTKEKKVLFEAPTWIGCVGIFTAHSPSRKLGAAINYRQTRDPSVFSLLANSYRVWKRYWPASYLLRHCFENNSDRRVLQHLLSASPLVAPCYFTLFDAKTVSQSVVITRGATDYFLVPFDVKKQGLVQTNCDDGKDAPNILCSVQRSKLAHSVLLQASKLTREKFVQQLLRKPLLNQETVYYCLMDEEKCETLVPK